MCKNDKTLKTYSSDVAEAEEQSKPRFLTMLIVALLPLGLFQGSYLEEKKKHFTTLGLNPYKDALFETDINNIIALNRRHSIITESVDKSLGKLVHNDSMQANVLQINPTVTQVCVPPPQSAMSYFFFPTSLRVFHGEN